MEGGNNCPVLVSCKKLKTEFAEFYKIPLTSDNFSLGRGLKNSVVVPFISISRNHCLFKKVENKWTIEDNSSFGIKVNGETLGKGFSKTLCDGDVILLEGSEEFVYKFTYPSGDEFEVPRKRMKMDDTSPNNKIINDVKMKFEESQTCEIKHIEEKIQNAKQMQNTSKILKQQLQTEMNRKILHLESEFALQIENLKGEKNEVERQKTILEEERDAQLATIKHEMENKISELMEQIQKHNESESELIKENNLLKEKLMKEREEFLLELSRENTSKQEILENLEAKIREQEDVRLKERQEFLEMLQRETEQLRLAKEKELKEIEEQRIQREQALKLELNTIKKNLEDKVQQTEQEKLKAEKMLNEQMEHMKKVSNEDKIAMQKLMKEREDIENKLNEAQTNAAKSLEELRTRVIDRETELAALAAERIQKQAEQSSVVIHTLQAQLEQVKSQLHTVETERNTILENICAPDNAGEGSSKQTVLTEMGELMESELQCSVCNELFVEATTLNCSHTFCKYCISVWKKKKKDCPICRAPITSECKSLVLDSFIEKMVQSLSEDMKRKRKDILDNRKELESELARQSVANSNRRRNSADESSEFSDFNDSEYYEEQEEEQEEDDYYGFHDGFYDSDGSGFDSDADEESAGGSSGGGAALVAGLPDAYYGGYGRCYRCGARGHWAPGCPRR
ncbi:E3 ubiquitin-protein ligase RNF8-like isoform X5 [Helicoverpa zea]|uniref:E3 ubiquitin-protein ligase RNF8-like isoform X5 n=1 Tax=Helicoverpa zea TaxID=7113 RepID=UPI001F58FDC1|nr:E3 ubiquitin-protein ligase RNF8-like isoform X5 [Helicoverpa zea]